MYGLDISHWTEWNSGPLTNKQLEDCANFNSGDGIKLWAVSIANQDIAREQIKAIASFPWPYHYEIITYRYYYWSNQRQAREADAQFINELRQSIYNIQFHIIDIEDDGTKQPVEANVFDTNDIINFWAGKCRTGMYTAKWVWDMLFGNYDGFNYMPLWFADWDWQEKLTLDEPFGGWTEGFMRQTFGDYRFQGIHCDTNYFKEFRNPPPIVTPPPPVIITPTVNITIPSGAVIKEPITITYSS